MSNPEWQNPKTNWTDADNVSYLEMNRLEGNILNTTTIQKATGTATALLLSTGTLFEGYTLHFIAILSNSKVATTINGIPLYKAGTTKAPSLTAGQAYTAWYSSINACYYYKI
jgi:hypothetical protein